MHCIKRIKCWLPAFAPFPTFSKAFFSRAVKSWDCAVKSYFITGQQNFSLDNLDNKLDLASLMEFAFTTIENVEEIEDYAGYHIFFLTLSQTIPGFYVSAGQVF